MIGPTLFRYIAWRFTKALLAMMALLLFLIVTVDFIEGLRKLNDQIDVSAGQVYLISLYTAPFFIDKAFPFACLFATMITLFQLNQKMELVVARAAGVSVWQFLLPIGAAAFAIGVFAATVYNPAAISFYQKSLDMKAELFGRKVETNAKTVSGFWMRQDDGAGKSTVINAKLARQGGTQLDGVRMLRFDGDGAIYSRIEAASAEHHGDRWKLMDVSITDSQQKTLQTASHEVETNLSAQYLLGVSGDADSTGFWDLRKTAERIRLSGLNHLPYLVQFHNLLALPLFLIAMVFIAASASLRFVRSGQAGKLILGGILGGFVLYASTRLVTSLGSNGIVPPLLAAWSPSLVAVLFGMSILLYQEDG
ncbi:LPS export ABC transporter permease LptG [Salaquimonas pukyongi]|uniref:LPS export ABC transporter permease LptG n=1 Tax=Salaquimonas pukyongi TaxID=2712698 RepID=UPI0009F8DA5F|nr:LPS export ABC transporter permease LptG [Salaquimonas pukyongi]